MCFCGGSKTSPSTSMSFKLLSSQIICENEIPLQAVRGVRMLHGFHYSSWKDFLCILFAQYFQRSPTVEFFVIAAVVVKCWYGGSKTLPRTSDIIYLLFLCLYRLLSSYSCVVGECGMLHYFH